MLVIRTTETGAQRDCDQFVFELDGTKLEVYIEKFTVNSIELYPSSSMLPEWPSTEPISRHVTA